MNNISGRNASSNKLATILIERSSIFTCPQPTKGVQQPADTLVRWTSSKPACQSWCWRSCGLVFCIDQLQSSLKVLPDIPPSQMELFDYIIFYFLTLFSFLHFWNGFLQCALSSARMCQPPSPTIPHQLQLFSTEFFLYIQLGSKPLTNVPHLVAVIVCIYITWASIRFVQCTNIQCTTFGANHNVCKYFTWASLRFVK